MAPRASKCCASTHPAGSVELKYHPERLTFTEADMAGVFPEAARVVALVRSWMYAVRSGITFHQLDGNARAFLWDLADEIRGEGGANRLPHGDIVRRLAEATLSDGRGLVVGATPERIDAALTLVRRAPSPR